VKPRPIGAGGGAAGGGVGSPTGLPLNLPGFPGLFSSSSIAPSGLFAMNGLERNAAAVAAAAAFSGSTFPSHSHEPRTSTSVDELRRKAHEHSTALLHSLQQHASEFHLHQQQQHQQQQQQQQEQQRRKDAETQHEQSNSD
jgi:hypothetical protein